MERSTSTYTPLHIRPNPRTNTSPSHRSPPSPPSSSSSSSSSDPKARPTPKEIRTHDDLLTSVPDSLTQVQTYISAIQAQVQQLQRIVSPGAVDDVKAMKRAMKDTHRDLEKLQREIHECDVKIALGGLTRQAWRVYRALVEMEEKVRRLVRVDEDMVRMKGEEKGLRDGKGKGQEKGRMREREQERERLLYPTLSTYVPAGATRSDLAKQGVASKRVERQVHVSIEEYQDVEGGAESSSARDGFAEDEDEGNDYGVAISDDTETEEEEAQVVGLRRRNAIRRSTRHESGPVLVRGRAEVQRNYDFEERISTPMLRDPDLRREGSTANGHYATMLVVRGNNDPRFVMPKLRYIKMHEVKQLREWLAEKKYVKRTGSISRIEKILHLFFLLQEGCRIETIAVLFSRTPRQVRQACKEVMQGLLELHSETALPQRQPTCDALWNISVMFFNEEEIVKRAEGYYGWEMWDIIKVLVTVNLFIGRFRQQGKFSLDGAYFHWWRAFRVGGST